jgi:hypothetical protein
MTSKKSVASVALAGGTETGSISDKPWRESSLPAWAYFASRFNKILSRTPAVTIRRRACSPGSAKGFIRCADTV